MYDYPYRLECSQRGQQQTYTVVRTGEGTICEGENLTELRRLVEAANLTEATKEKGR